MLFDPDIGRVLAVGKRLSAASQHIEIVGGVARRACYRMVAFWHEHCIIIARQQYRVDGKTGLVQWRFWSSVNTLKGKTFGSIYLVEIDFLKVGFQYLPRLVSFMYIMLMRRIA